MLKSMQSIFTKTDTDESVHFSHLLEAYETVGERTWLYKDFEEQNLEISRGLFVPESLDLRKPRPKQLEVYALLSGLSFNKEFTDGLVSAQMRISDLLTTSLHYWVEPENLGLEYCVFKWPMESWSDRQCAVVQGVLAQINLPTFKFHIKGVQINPDGCVVARGYDENASVFQIRALVKKRIPLLPKKQSGWAHVPLGRILEPLGTPRFEQLNQLIREMSDMDLGTTEINTMKLIHETRWYMEERTVLAEYQFNGQNKGVN